MIALSVVAGGDSLPRLVPPQGAVALSRRGRSFTQKSISL
jgi:hypothetical protein